MWPNSVTSGQNFVTLTEEIRNGKLPFLCSAIV